jgi:hypothetical protein
MADTPHFISYESNINDNRLAVIEYDTMSIKDLPNTLIVQEENGDLICLRVSAGTKQKLWEFLRYVLEKVFGPIMKAAFVRVIKKGGDFLAEQDKLSADTKKKKGEANDVEKLMAFSKIKVSFSCLNQKNEFARARAAGTEKFNVKRLPSDSTDIGCDLGKQIILENPYKSDPIPSTQSTDSLKLEISSQRGSSIIEIPASQLSKVDRLALSLLLSYETVSKEDYGIFQGFETAVEVKNEPKAMVALIDTLACAMTPIERKDDEDSAPLKNVDNELCKCECILQTSEWWVNIKMATKDFKPTSSPRTKSFTSALNSLKAMFLGRSLIHSGLGLRTDSQSIQSIA